MTGAMELADQLDTVEARHPNVGNNGIKAVAGDRVQSFLTVGGFGDAAVAGLGHLAGNAWDGIKSVGHGIAGGASQVYNWMT